MLLKYNIDRSV